MVKSFKDRETEKVFRQQISTKLPRDIQKQALIKLMLIDAAEHETDLTSPPGNKLKKLKGKRNGEYSVRINDQWRICFLFKNGDAFNVSIEDYH